MRTTVRSQPDTHAVLVRAGVIGLSAEGWVPAVAFDSVVGDE
jgi:hypothetical protein